MQHQKEALSVEEQRKAHEKHKAMLLESYRHLKEELEYATDSVEEGLIREKREKLAGEIKSLSAKISELDSEESSA